MRLISTLCLLLLSSVGFSQIYEMIRASEYQNHKSALEISNVSFCRGFGGILGFRKDLATLQADAINKDTSQMRVFIRTAANQNSSQFPLYVIDGVPYLGSDKLSELKPDNIESVNLIKKSSLIFSCHATQRDIILITTKYAESQKFIIKDFLDGERIAGATVSFISPDKRDTLMTQANDSGVVVINNLKRSVNYSINVSSVGYKTLSQTYIATSLNAEQEILVERDLKICNEVILATFPVISCGRNYSVTKVTSCPLQTVSDSTGSLLETFSGNVSISAKIFPNPLVKGNAFTIETSTEAEQPVIIKITGLDGKTLFSQSQKAIKGVNRFSISTDSRWASGIYLVHLYANGQLLASGKVILQ